MCHRGWALFWEVDTNMPYYQYMVMYKCVSELLLWWECYCECVTVMLVSLVLIIVQFGVSINHLHLKIGIRGRLVLYSTLILFEECIE